MNEKILIELLRNMENIEISILKNVMEVLLKR